VSIQFGVRFEFLETRFWSLQPCSGSKLNTNDSGVLP
jgi:hypothetical protein